MTDSSNKYLETVYPVIAARRTAFDTLMWQVPALGLAAQAFLLTIALGSGSSDVSRVISGGLSAVVALVAIQTMLKHQANELTDSLILEEIEGAMGISVGTGVRPHAKPEDRGSAVKNEKMNSWWVKQKSAKLWVISLICFASAGVAAVVLALFWPEILGH